jgi:MFS family permease
VAEAMRANAAIRVFSGFLLFFLLFIVQEGHLAGLDPKVTIAVLAAAAGGGGLAGAAVASWARHHSPQRIVLGTLAVATVTGVATAVLFNVWAAVVVALIAAFAQELGKLALDAIVQREIGEEVRSSTFGVVEALLQIAWVSGGLLGLVMSLYSSGPVALALLSGAMAIALLWLLVTRHTRLRAVRRKTTRAREDDAHDTTTEIMTHRPSDPGEAPSHTKPLTNPHG